MEKLTKLEAWDLVVSFRRACYIRALGFLADRAIYKKYCEEEWALYDKLYAYFHDREQ